MPNDLVLWAAGLRRLIYFESASSGIRRDFLQKIPPTGFCLDGNFGPGPSRVAASVYRYFVRRWTLLKYMDVRARRLPEQWPDGGRRRTVAT